MAKYRFRKMYFICENKKVIEPNVHRTTAYQYKKVVDEVFTSMDKSVKQWQVGRLPISYSVEGFYLVHESLFDALLKEHSK